MVKRRPVAPSSEQRRQLSVDLLSMSSNWGLLFGLGWNGSRSVCACGSSGTIARSLKDEHPEKHTGELLRHRHPPHQLLPNSFWINDDDGVGCAIALSYFAECTHCCRRLQRVDTAENASASFRQDVNL